ncbi:MAG: hypothetical protein ACE5KZ_07820 [Candidatus Scalinduaceae bacterium]
MKLHTVQVNAYAGYKAEERPLSFIFKGKECIVEEIICQTYEENNIEGLKRRYTVKTDEGLVFKLHYYEDQDQWFLEE